jgi:hypothetical protein
MNNMKNTFTILLLFSVSSIFRAQYSCGTAVAISSGFSTSSNIITPGNNGIQDWVSSANVSCGTATTSLGGFVNSDVYLFKYTTGSTAGETLYFTISYDEATYGPHSIGVWDNCSGAVLSGCRTSVYKFNDIVGVCAQNLAANTTYYIGVSKEWASLDGENLNFKVVDFTVELSNTQPNDDCNLAPTLGVSNSFTGSTRCNYSPSAGSPSVCGMSIENDSWVKFIASSTTVVVNYSVTGCTNNYGVQMSVFSGNCSSLTLVSGTCLNYAANNSSGTYTLNGLTVGQTYYLRADGYAGDLCSYTYNAISGVTTPTGLPVTVEHFTASCSGDRVLLNWVTSSEHNSSYFVVEKSRDGYSWHEVASLPGALNSNSENNYYTEDEYLAEWDIAYYRLIQVDTDGNRIFFEPVSVRCEKIEAVWSIHPNPGNEDLWLYITSKESDEEVVVQLYSESGKKYEERKITLSYGSNMLDLSELNLVRGLYIIQLKSDKRETSIKKYIRI